MNLVFMSDTHTPNRNDDVDLLPFNSYTSEIFFEYTRLNNDWIRDKKWDDVKITEELPNTEKYIIFWDTFDSTATMENMIRRDTSVSKKILSDLKEAKCSIVFFHTDLIWNTFNKEDWEDFYTAVKGIDLKRFYFLFDEQVMNDDFKDIDLGFNVFTERSWPAHYTLQSDNWARPQDGYQPSLLLSLLENTRGYYRQFKYCTHNNNIKDHRVELLLFLIKNDLLDDGLWSWFGGNEPIEQGVNQLDFANFESVGYGKVDYTVEYGKEVVDIAHNLVPYTHDYKLLQHQYSQILLGDFYHFHLGLYDLKFQMTF